MKQGDIYLNINSTLRAAAVLSVPQREYTLFKQEYTGSSVHL